jgi:hypothetical protein
MIKQTKLAAAVAAIALFGSAALGFAADAPATQPAVWAPPAAPTATDDACGVDTITLAQDLAAWGRANHNPSALAMASRIMATVPSKPWNDAKKDADGKDTALGSAEHRVTYEMTPAALHAEAEAMAGTNAQEKAAIAGIDAASGTTSRGAVIGIIRHEDEVSASSNDTYHIAFKGGELADIAIIGDGHTPLDLVVTDAAGNIVAQDSNGADRDHVAFTPAQTQTYEIKIKNSGAMPNAYTLYTN